MGLLKADARLSLFSTLADDRFAVCCIRLAPPMALDAESANNLPIVRSLYGLKDNLETFIVVGLQITLML